MCHNTVTPFKSSKTHLNIK